MNKNWYKHKNMFEQ